MCVGIALCKKQKKVGKYKKGSKCLVLIDRTLFYRFLRYPVDFKHMMDEQFVTSLIPSKNDIYYR